MKGFQEIVQGLVVIMHKQNRVITKLHNYIVPFNKVFRGTFCALINRFFCIVTTCTLKSISLWELATKIETTKGIHALNYFEGIKSSERKINFPSNYYPTQNLELQETRGQELIKNKTINTQGSSTLDTTTQYTFAAVVANMIRNVSYISGSVLLLEHENSTLLLIGNTVPVCGN